MYRGRKGEEKNRGEGVFSGCFYMVLTLGHPGKDG